MKETDSAKVDQFAAEIWPVIVQRDRPQSYPNAQGFAVRQQMSSVSLDLLICFWLDAAILQRGTFIRLNVGHISRPLFTGNSNIETGCRRTSLTVS